MNFRIFRPVLWAACLLSSLGVGHAVPVLKGYWEFGSAATGSGYAGVAVNGAASPFLVPEGTAPAYSASITDGTTSLSGAITTVVGPGNRVKLAHGIAANGGGTKVNKYTLMFDVFSPTASQSKWRCLYQTDTGNTSDGEYFINTTKKLGSADLGYSAAIDDTKWKRVVISVDLGNSYKVYVNGALFYTHTAPALDSARYALGSQMLLFGDNDSENNAMNVGAVAIWDGALSPAAVAALGNPGTAVSTLPAANATPVIAQGALMSMNAVKNGGASSATLGGSDGDLDFLTWSIATPASHGTATVTGANTTCPVSYTPAAGFSGTDTFVVQATDGSASASITVNVVVTEGSDSPQIVGLWSFDNASNRNLATVGFDLVPSGTGFTVVPGVAAGDGAMEIGVGSFYRVTHGVPPNGSTTASKANRYTMVWDVKIPTASASVYKTLFQSNTANTDDGELFINTTNKVGAGAFGGYSTNSLATNIWYRVVVSVDNGGARTIWVNGVKVFTGSAGSLDDARYSLGGQFLAFADENGEDGLIDVSAMAMFNGALTDAQITLLGSAGSPINITLPPKPTPYALWQFDEPTRPEAATIGNRLVRNGSSFTPMIGRVSGDGAMEIGSGSHYLVDHGIAANGGGSKVNEYSILFDVKAPSAGSKAFYQTTLANTDDAEILVNPSGNVGHAGIGGYSTQAISPGSWYRVLMVVKNGTDRSLYVNGSLWYDGNVGVVDDSYALDPAGFLAFADNDGEDGPLDVTNLAIWNRALSFGEIVAMGDTAVAVADGVTPVSPNSVPMIGEGETYTLNSTKNGSASTVTLHAADGNNEALIWNIETAPGHGVAQVSGSNTSAVVSYTPANGFAGLDSFVVRTSDGWSSDSITFNVTVTDPFADPVLTIVSAHGTASPASGTYPHPRGTILNNSVADSVGATSRDHCIGWSMVGDGPHTGTSNSMSMTLTRDSTLTWLWRTEHRVELATAGTGTINVSSGWYEANRPIQITATAGAGYYFAGWSGDTTGCTIGGKNIVIPVARAHAAITANFSPVENFTVVGLPDTQNYCAITNITDIFERQTKWVVDNKETYNIKFLTHVGDIVDSATATSQWNRATTAMDLLNAKLPYGVATGNHDLANGSTHYIDRFGPNQPRWVDPATGQVYSWYQGSSPRGYSSYQVISVNGRDYMFLHIDCDCPDSDMAWAATVLTQHPRTVTMLTTHNYLAETGGTGSTGSGTGQRGRVSWGSPYISVGPDRNTVTDIWNTLVKPFNQVYMVICGHNFAQYNVGDTNAAGKTVHQVLADYQTLPNGGNGFLRIMEFRPGQNQIYNTTYSPLLGRFISNSSSPSANITADTTGMRDLNDINGGEFSLTTDFDTRFNHNLTIASSQTTVTPAVGTVSIEEGTAVVASANDRIVGTTRYRCTGWTLSGGQVASGSTKDASFVMGNDATLTWNWATEYYLDTLATGRGVVSVSSGYQPANAAVNILAQPDNGASFLQWSGDIAGCTINGNSISVPMDRGRGPVTAEFTALVPSYNVVVSSAHAGVTPAPASYSYEEGTSVTFSAEDVIEGGTRYICTGWNATGAVTQSGTSKSTTLTVTGNFTLTWNWKTQHLLQTNVNGPGTVSGNGEWVDEGANFQVTATPGPGAAFGGWTGDTALGNGVSNLFTIANMSRPVGPLTANFATGYHTFAVVSDHGGILPVPGTISVPHGTEVSFSAEAVENGRSRFVPAGWSLNTGTSGGTRAGSVIVNEDTTLTWSWTPEVVLELVSGVEGSIVPTNAGGWRTQGENVVLTAQPTADFLFAGWKGDIAGAPTTLTVTVTMDQPRRIAADFKPITAPNGTPKWWLERYAHVVDGNLAAAELADFDGDGKTAAEEFLAGMSDLDARQVFKVTDLHKAGPTMELTWPGAKGRVYGVWSSTTLVTPFSLVQNNIPAIEPFTSFQASASGTKQFYKVKADLAPGGALDADSLASSGEPKPGSLVREMKLIPAGTFQMGDSTGDIQASMPVHPVAVAAFFMDKFEVTLADWKKVATWAVAHGYDIPVDLNFSPPLDHPAPGVSWYQAVKWCNARSEMEGRVPAYYTDTMTTTVYRTGAVDLVSANVNWAGNGYRLPTEAEWERACRGGLESKIFSWGDQLLTSQANIWQYQVLINHTESPYPLSTPVGYFNGHQTPAGTDMVNGYGLYDMAGNAWEWCWDRNGVYDKPLLYDPKGPNVGNLRITRGGSWWNNETDMTNAIRYPFPPIGESVYGQIGFRTIRAAAPNEVTQ